MRWVIAVTIVLVGCGGSEPAPAPVPEAAVKLKSMRGASSFTDLEKARIAARAFSKSFDFPDDKIREIAGPPTTNATLLASVDGGIQTYEWLGPGHGSSYVRVELNKRTGSVVVFGGYGGRKLGPWKHRIDP